MKTSSILTDNTRAAHLLNNIINQVLVLVHFTALLFDQILSFWSRSYVEKAATLENNLQAEF